MKVRSFLLPVLALFGCGGCESKPSPTYSAPPVSSVTGGADPTGVVRYLAIGDSLSQGIGAADTQRQSFPALLAEKWRAKGCKVELKNLGVRNYTAQDMITNELPEIAGFKPTLITIQVGSNDVASKVPLETFRKNVVTILEAAKKSGARVIVIPQNEWFRSPEGPSYGKNLADQRIKFDDALMEETKARGAEVADLRLVFKQQADKKQWAEDGIHPLAECYEAWAAELARVIPAPCSAPKP